MLRFNSYHGTPCPIPFGIGQYTESIMHFHILTSQHDIHIRYNSISGILHFLYYISLNIGSMRTEIED